MNKLLVDGVKWDENELQSLGGSRYPSEVILGKY